MPGIVSMQALKILYEVLYDLVDLGVSEDFRISYGVMVALGAASTAF